MAQVFRVERNKNFTVMSNHHFKNKDLSLKAKGLLSLMLSLPEDWNYNMQGLATLSRDGSDHGYGNMKTVTRCFPSGVARYDKESIFFTMVCIIRLEKNTRSSVQRKRRMRTVQWS